MRLLKADSRAWYTADYLQELFPYSSTSNTILINGSIIPDEELAQALLAVEPGCGLYADSELIAFKTTELTRSELEQILASGPGGVRTEADSIARLKHCWDVFLLNGEEICADYHRMTARRVSAPLSGTNLLLGPAIDVFLEEGVVAEGATFNTTDGPIYLGKGAKVMEGAMIRGPFAMCEKSVVKMGARIYGGSTFGPHSKVGGEVSNVVFQGYSNKGHEGYLGNAVLGEWCNLGADSNNSNLKNNYGLIKAWCYADKPRYIDTGLQFCGLIMGDHSKCGINTMFNTATVVGVSANIYGPGFPSKFIPSYTWGAVEQNYTYKFEKAMETAELVMARRSLDLSAEEKRMLQKVFELSAPFRKWEKSS